VSFCIRRYSPKDRQKVRALVLNLTSFYPGIQKWLDEKELDRLDRRESVGFVVEQDDDIAGVSLSGYEKKEANLVKLRTFYLNKENQKNAIGNYLLEITLDYWAKQKASEIFVSFAEEELGLLAPYFEKYGFTLFDKKLGAYREGKYEFYMKKIMCYGAIPWNYFVDFLQDCATRLGFDIVSCDVDSLMLQNTNALPEQRSFFVKVVKEPGADAIKACKLEKEKAGSDIGVLISFESFPTPTMDSEVKIFDGFDVERLFYPGVLTSERAEPAFIQPIFRDYSRELFFRGEQQVRLGTPPKVSMRSEKVYYKKPPAELVRGQVFLVYESASSKKIIGEARVKEVCKLNYLDAFKRFSNRGVLKPSELREHSDDEENTLCIVLNHTIQYKHPVSIEDLGLSVPQSHVFIGNSTLTDIRKRGGYFGFEESKEKKAGNNALD